MLQTLVQCIPYYHTLSLSMRKHYFKANGINAFALIDNLLTELSSSKMRGNLFNLMR